MQAAQTPFVVKDTAQVIEQDVSIANNFTGQLVNGSTPVAGAGIEISRNPNPSSNADWSQVITVQTDSQGNFATSLAPGTWYVLGYNDNGVWTQLGLKEVLTSAQVNVPLNVAPNVNGTVVWGTGTHPTVSKASVIVKNLAMGQTENAEVQNVNSDTWTFSFALSVSSDTTQNQYQVIGLNLQDANGKQKWWDLSQNGDGTFAVQTGTPTTLSLGMAVKQGTIQGASLAASGYVVFQSKQDASKFVSVPYETVNGQMVFQTTFDNSAWSVYSVHSADTAYTVVSSAYSNGSWTIATQ